MKRTGDKVNLCTAKNYKVRVNGQKVGYKRLKTEAVLALVEMKGFE
jgi:hypothetical protein